MRSMNPHVCICCGRRLSEEAKAGYGSTLKIICPVFVELDRDARGKVVIGRSTRMACDLAISIANEDPRNSIIITPGGCASKEWDHAWAGGLMGNYIKARTQARVLRQMANKFDTLSEISIVAYAVRHMSRREKCFSEIVLVEQSGRAPQTAFICRQLLNELKLHHIPVSPRTYELPVGWRALAREYFGAWPKNLIRVLLQWAMN
jgi:hypothetical protein